MFWRLRSETLVICYIVKEKNLQNISKSISNWNFLSNFANYFVFCVGQWGKERKNIRNTFPRVWTTVV